MAKASYPCPDCGTHITIEGRNRRDADYQASRATRVCKACSDAAFAKANAEAASSAIEAGLPALQGTPKQVAWAETLRRDVLAQFERAEPFVEASYRFSPGFDSVLANSDREDEEDDAVSGIRRSARQDLLAAARGWEGGFRYGGSEIWRCLPSRERWNVFAHLVREQNEARWWIDNKGFGLESLAQTLLPEIITAETAAKPGAPEQAALEAEVMAEAVLKPACELSGKRIADVTYGAPHLRIRYDVKNDVLRELVKGRGFRWEHSVWERRLDERHGDPVHRIAETAHMLLAAGFQVRVMNNDARELAVSGGFEPEQTRWLRLRRDGERAGWTVASWLPHEDLYDEAKRVPGARYVAFEGVLFPPTAITEAIDFAESHDFAVSDGARAALAAHEAALSAGIVVDAKPRAPKKLSKSRPVLAASQEGIDADLLDRD